MTRAQRGIMEHHLIQARYHLGVAELQAATGGALGYERDLEMLQVETDRLLISSLEERKRPYRVAP